jgi:peptide/nickel transport system substrate-binding protein
MDDGRWNDLFGEVARASLPRRALLQSAAVFGAAIFLDACTGNKNQATPSGNPSAGSQGGYQPATFSKVPQRSSKDTLIAAVAALPNGIDADFSDGNVPTWEAMANVHDTPVEFAWIDYPFPQPPEGQGVGYISFTKTLPFFFSSAELSSDATKATFKIIPGVKSPVGNELTSEDFKYRLERAFGSKGIGAFFAAIITVDPKNPITVIDKYTFRMNSTGPQPLLAALWADSYWTVVDSTEYKKHATASDPWAEKWAAQHSVGFGAYEVTEFSPGSQVVLEANPNYFRGVPPIKKVIYSQVPSPSNRLAAIQSGAVDMAYELPIQLWKRAKSSANLKPIAVEGNFVLHCYMSTVQEPFIDPRVRQAFNYAVPRQQIVDSVYQGYATPWLNVISSVFPGADSITVPWTNQPDIAKAKSLMAAAGKSAGVDVTLDYDSSVDAHAQVGIILRDALAQIGVKVTLNPQSNATFTSSVFAHQPAFALWADSLIHPDPIFYLATEFDTTGSTNQTEFSVPEIDAMIEKAKATVEPNKRIVEAKAIADKVIPLAPRLWLVEPFYTNVLANNLQGFRWHTTQQSYFSDMYFT